MEQSFKLNPHATPFVPASKSSFTESLKEKKVPEKQVDETADKFAGYELPDSLSFDDYAESLGKINICAESSSKEDAAGRAVAPSQYKGSDADYHLAIVQAISLRFPDVSADFILEALKVHAFDAESTIEMLSNLCEADGTDQFAEVSGKPPQQQPHHP